VGELRKPVLIVVVVLLILVVLLELGATQFLNGSSSTQDRVERVESSDAFRNELSAEERTDAVRSVEEYADSNDPPPGLGIPYLALIDGILAYTILLIALGLIVPDHLEGKVQGIITLILSFLLLLGAIVLTLIALFKLIVMVSLFFAPPFGTIAYLAVWGAFDTGGAAVVLSLVMLLKVAASIGLPIAHQRFLDNKGLVLLVLTSLIATIIVGFLHGLVPFPMVSITDALAAIIVGIIAIIWAVVVLVGAVVAVVEALATR
jgi:hypothetical protein